jgi:hypothetical protein
MNKTFCTAGAGMLPLTSGRALPSNLHLRSHGDHIFGTWLGRPVTSLILPCLDDGQALVVRSSGKTLEIVTSSPTAAASGAVVVSAASGRAAQ